LGVTVTNPVRLKTKGNTNDDTGPVPFMPNRIDFENEGGRFEMNKVFFPEKYGMVICPLCNGKGFLIKQSGRVNVTPRSVCTRCGGFGAVKKEEEVFRNVGD